MESLLDELTRVVAYGGLGMLLGFLVGTLVNDRHRVVTEILDEAERDVPTSNRRRLSGDTLQNLITIVFMVLLLLSGLTSLQNSQVLQDQARDDCLRATETSKTLRARTKNYLDKAVSEVELWKGQRAALVRGGIPKDAPLVTNFDDYLRELRSYVNHLEENPYPQRDPEDC